MSGTTGSHLTRRALLKCLGTAGATVALTRRIQAQAADGREAVLRYLEAHARPDGGYAFEDQVRSHLTPTFAAIGSYRLLGERPPRRGSLIDFVRANHPRELKPQERQRRHFDFQQVQSLVWLGDDAAAFRERIRPMLKPISYPKISERHGYPVFQSELAMVQCHALLGLPLAPLLPAFAAYLAARRRENGSFNNTPAAEGGDGHVMNTLWGLQACRTLRLPESKKAEAVAWLRSTQLPSGGFTFQPRPPFGGVDDVAYTRAALRALQFVGAGPANREACAVWLLSLANADGGFGDRPGWQSNPVATYHALDALDALDALGALEAIRPLTAARRRAPPSRVSLPPGLKIFSIQVQAHGTGSPAEAVALAGALRIDLWGAKLAKPEWLLRVRALAAEQRVPVQFFAANEEHGCWMEVPGLGTYSHMSDVFAPGDSDFGSPVGLDRATAPAVSWEEFRRRRLAPLERARGRLMWQAGSNEELVRMFLDDSLDRGGYSAISTFHFGNPDLTNTEPFLHRWRGRIPYIALQDAHGAEPWWFADSTLGFRTLFLATEPTWDGWLNALKQNWTVAVRHDALSRDETWMHAGSRAVLDFVRERESNWRWWGESSIQRPPVSLVALTPASTLEVGQPAAGAALRVRGAWKNTGMGFPQTPLVEFVSLTVDDEEVATELIEKKRPDGTGLADAYRYVALPTLSRGRHVSTVTIRELATGRIQSKSIDFNL